MTQQPFDPDDRERRLLEIARIPGYVFGERATRLDRVSNYTSSTDGLNPLPVKRTEQLADIQTVLADPTHAPYVMCICSEPNDLQAKVLAATVVLAALRARHTCLWHTVIGGYRDEVRDNRARNSRNDLFVFSNINAGDSDVKIEKLRDLMEIYSDRPRVVTLTGMEPIAFFNAIGYPLNYSVWLRSGRTHRVLGN